MYREEGHPCKDCIHDTTMFVDDCDLCCRFIAHGAEEFNNVELTFETDWDDICHILNRDSSSKVVDKYQSVNCSFGISKKLGSF